MTSTTVLIPTTHHDHWLDESVRSVVDAPGDERILVIFDGGVPDGSADWLSSDRVEAIILPQRGGLAAALNLGLRTAATPYVARLDADDVALPGRISRQSAFLDAHPDVVVVSGSAQKIDGEGNPLGRLTTPSGAFDPDVRRGMLRRNWLVHPATILRREVALEAGGYDESLRFMEDYDLWLRLALVGPLAMTADDEIKYRMHANQMTKAAPPRGPHISSILQRRRTLARELRVSPLVQAANDGAWWGAQVARSARASVLSRWKRP